MKKLTMRLVMIGLLTATFAQPAQADILWLGNDTIGDVIATTPTGAVVQTIPNLPVTGIAWDGASLYFVNRQGDFTRRTADGSTVLGSFFVASNDTGEDLAWDTTRNELWRIVHTNVLQEINPVTGTLVNSYNLPTADAILGPLGGLGIAYDPGRDRLYVSYCQAGCTALAAGLVQEVDPATGTVLGDLFRTDFYTGGLGYDPLTDTLWVGGTNLVRNMSLDGTVNSSFVRPGPAGFPDGLEFVESVPEPATVGLLALGLATVFAWGRRRFVR